MTSTRAKPLADELFRSRPSQHVQCLMDAVALAEEGRAAVRARSDAWAAQHVVATLHSIAEGARQSCWPAGSAYDITPFTGLTEHIETLSTETGLAVGVVSLASLAMPRGVLDQLAAAGYAIDGPAWH